MAADLFLGKNKPKAAGGRASPHTPVLLDHWSLTQKVQGDFWGLEPKEAFVSSSPPSVSEMQKPPQECSRDLESMRVRPPAGGADAGGERWKQPTACCYWRLLCWPKLPFFQLSAHEKN